VHERRFDTLKNRRDLAEERFRRRRLQIARLCEKHHAIHGVRDDPPPSTTMLCSDVL
jgi:hypothetical protein